MDWPAVGNTHELVMWATRAPAAELNDYLRALHNATTWTEALLDSRARRTVGAQVEAALQQHQEGAPQ